MQEIELKFQVPEVALQSVQTQLGLVPGNGREHLQAHYFDTPDRRLGRARSALRLRKEGARWVQTLKAVGANTMIRLEDNQRAPAPAEGSAARIDLSLHRGSPAQDALVKVLGWHPQGDPAGHDTGLVELYRTDIWRQSARLTAGQGTPHEGAVELALDLGHIHAGELSMPVRELEIESIEGHPMAVILAAREWVLAHGLWLDTRTKAHRGDRLARQAAKQALSAAEQPNAGNDLASALEQMTDAMSQVAIGPHEATGQPVDDWVQALHSLSCATGLPSQALPAVDRLRHELEHGSGKAAPTTLARSPSTTLLCLELFAALL